MNAEISQKENLLYRLLLALAVIIIASALRIAPHPWNFTPVGAMALFSGALIKDRRLAFAFPLLALFAGDLFIGFYKLGLMLMVYASFLLSVSIGRWLRDRRTITRITLATLLGAIGVEHDHTGHLPCHDTNAVVRVLAPPPARGGCRSASSPAWRFGRGTRRALRSPLPFSPPTWRGSSRARGNRWCPRGRWEGRSARSRGRARAARPAYP